MTTVDTRVTVDHIFHHSLDRWPLENQPNRTFAHRLDWFLHCRFCRDLRSPEPKAVA